MDKRQISIAFRDGINKLTGKQSLIEQYNHAVHVLSRKSDSLSGKPEQKALLERIEEITESKWFNGEHGTIVSTSFNPYLIGSTKSKLRTKIDMLNKLMQEYKVK